MPSSNYTVTRNSYHLHIRWCKLVNATAKCKPVRRCTICITATVDVALAWFQVAQAISKIWQKYAS